MKPLWQTFIGATAAFVMFGAPNAALGQRIETVLGLPRVSHGAMTKELTAMADTARQAAETDNCVRKSVFINRLWDIYRDGNHPFWVRHDLAGESPSLQATRQRHLDLIRQQVGEINAIPCPKQSAAQQGRVEVQVGGGGQLIRQPKRSHLGTETGGVQRLGLVTPDREVSGSSFSGSLKYYLPYLVYSPLTLLSSDFMGIPMSSWIKIHGFYAESEANRVLGTIDPGAGNSLLILGTNGPATGFALGAHPLNVVRNATYSADLTKTGARIDFGQATQVAADIVVDVFFSAGYTNLSYEEIFAGSIPGFLRDFRYSSDAKVDILTLAAGLQIAYNFLVTEDAKFELGGSFQIGPSFAWGRGTDSLAFTGFPTSSAGLSASNTDFSLRAGLSAAVQFKNGLRLSVDGSYMRETGMPVFDRPATNYTQLLLENGDAFVGMGRVSYSFGGGR